MNRIMWGRSANKRRGAACSVRGCRQTPPPTSIIRRKQRVRRGYACVAHACRQTRPRSPFCPFPADSNRCAIFAGTQPTTWGRGRGTGYVLPAVCGVRNCPKLSRCRDFWNFYMAVASLDADHRPVAMFEELEGHIHFL